MSEPCVALVPIFQPLTREQQEEVAAYARPVSVERGATLVRAGERQARLFVVHEGRVKLSTTTAEGRETILQVLGPGQVAGEVWFLTGDRPEQDCVALEPSRVCVIDHDALRGLIRKYPDIGVAMMRSLAERLAGAERMLAARTLADVGARVAAYLLDLPASWGPDGAATVTLPLAKKDVATFLGSSPETLSRRLAALEADGLIRVRGSHVDILDTGALDLRARGA
ncbi:Crp/Fnr family transcriptional regulator [Phycicoccus sp.]|uniref:Crp/Fnr family transcriptional regulator n=1 Tax=Phycicoccus sp. TaxID=1902410 RepID=UPI002C8461D4|nr:Crp/Fnr family transcriptional regulator [Phycicoccus sp.]HMM95830.1 Crp/Fnr family transcriptional regulator [Phycicoccus sp.]